jgi:hypothetical protein
LKIGVHLVGMRRRIYLHNLRIPMKKRKRRTMSWEWVSMKRLKIGRS